MVTAIFEINEISEMILTNDPDCRWFPADGCCSGSATAGGEWRQHSYESIKAPANTTRHVVIETS
jgi:hypothetical protein